MAVSWADKRRSMDCSDLGAGRGRGLRNSMSPRSVGFAAWGLDWVESSPRRESEGRLNQPTPHPRHAGDSVALPFHRAEFWSAVALYRFSQRRSNAGLIAGIPFGYSRWKAEASHRCANSSPWKYRHRRRGWCVRTRAGNPPVLAARNQPAGLFPVGREKARGAPAILPPRPAR